jgi:hypothetical protein
MPEAARADRCRFGYEIDPDVLRWHVGIAVFPEGGS